jgi:glycerol-3-phosphate acyltransferase PlsY
MEYFLVLAANYLLGSMPSAYIVGRLKGIDITQHGSGNVGATNAFRVLGKWAGLVVLIIDCLKGVIGVLLARQVGNPWFVIIAALVVVAGHNYSLFLKFKGGKGVATAAGIFLVLAPGTVLAALFVFITVVAVSKYVSLGSLVTAATLPIIMMLIGEPLPVRILGAVVAIFVIFRHTPNIKRLLAGKENKITDKLH